MKKSAKQSSPTGASDPTFAAVVNAFAKRRDVTYGKLMSFNGLKVKPVNILGVPRLALGLRARLARRSG